VERYAGYLLYETWSFSCFGIGFHFLCRLWSRIHEADDSGADIASFHSVGTAILKHVLGFCRQEALKHVEHQTCRRRFGTTFTSRNYQWLDSEHQWRVYHRCSSGLSQPWRCLQYSKNIHPPVNARSVRTALKYSDPHFGYN